jgi:hypothetical protein
MPHPLIRTLCTLAAAGSAALAAQQPLPAKAFLPDEHRNVMFVDLAAMRSKAVWDEVEISLLKAMLQQLEQQTGMAMRTIDRVTAVVDPGEVGADQPRQRGDVRQVLVVEGNAALALPPAAQRSGDDVEIGGHKVRSRHGEICALVHPHLYVAGDEAWVRPVLEGTPHRGTPAPDVMSLLAGTEPLAAFVLDVTTPLLRAQLLATAFRDAVWPDGEAPTFVCLRLIATGDPDDPHLTLEGVVRHTKDGAGVAITTKAIEALRDRLGAMPELRAVKPVLAGTTTKTDRGDVQCTLDLGRVRNAIGHVAALGALMVVARAEVRVEAAAVPAVPAPAPVPAPVTPPAGEKKK